MTGLFGQQIPPVDLPSDIDAIVREFEGRWRARDAAGFAALFTPDGVMRFGRDWQVTPAGIHLAGLGRGGTVRLHAQAFGVDSTLAFVAGSYAADSELPPGDAGRFMFALRKVDGGPWRIAAATLTDLPAETRLPAATVDELIGQLDGAGIRRAALLSWAYQFGGVGRIVADEAKKVSAENDWTAAQAARFPDRLVAFCSVNPLKDYALAELNRCLADSRFTGIKLHLTTAGVDFRDAAHVDRLRAVFQAANTRQTPIIVHMRTLNPAYGRRDAQIFLNDVLAAAPDSPVQIAHVAGWGGYGPETDAAFEVFAQASAAGDRRVRNLWVDLSGVSGLPEQRAALLAGQLRQLGIGKLLFGIDGPVNAAAWQTFSRSMPVSSEELRTIAGNLAPYFRR